MSIVKIILKGVGLLLVLAVIAIFVVIRYGSYEERYKCDGKITDTADSLRTTVFLKFQLYRPWMFWANSGGMAWSEIPNQELEYYSKVQRVGDFLQFSTHDLKRLGGFSTLSNALWLDTRDGRFEGACKLTEPAA